MCLLVEPVSGSKDMNNELVLSYACTPVLPSVAEMEGIYVLLGGGGILLYLWWSL